MTITELTSFFAWSTLINYGVLMVWLLVFTLAHDWFQSMHEAWFKVSEQQFNMVNYCGMGLFKLFIMIFNFAPYIVLRIME